MKRGIWGRTVAVIAALCLVASVSTAASKGKDPLVGNWDLDASSSTVNGQAAFKSGHVSITATKDVRKTVVDLVPASGAAIHYESAVKYDGMNTPVVGNTYFDSATMLQVDRNTLIRTERRGGKVVGVTTIEVAKDGKSFTGTSKGTSPDGKQFTRALIWHRAKTKK
jgi:hypothetical protein